MPTISAAAIRPCATLSLASLDRQRPFGENSRFLDASLPVDKWSWSGSHRAPAPEPRGFAEGFLMLDAHPAPLLQLDEIGARRFARMRADDPMKEPRTAADPNRIADRPVPSDRKSGVPSMTQAVPLRARRAQAAPSTGFALPISSSRLCKESLSRPFIGREAQIEMRLLNMRNASAKAGDSGRGERLHPPAADRPGALCSARLPALLDELTDALVV